LPKGYVFYSPQRPQQVASAKISVRQPQQITSDPAQTFALLGPVIFHVGTSRLCVRLMPTEWDLYAAARSTSLTGRPLTTAFPYVSKHVVTCPVMGKLKLSMHAPTPCRDVKRAHRERAARLQTSEDPLQVRLTLLDPCKVPNHKIRLASEDGSEAGMLRSHKQPPEFCILSLLGRAPRSKRAWGKPDHLQIMQKHQGSPPLLPHLAGRGG